MKKKFIAVREDNGDVSLIKAEDENSEAVVVFQFIKELINENHSENINENDNQRKSKNKCLLSQRIRPLSFFSHCTITVSAPVQIHFILLYGGLECVKAKHRAFRRICCI